MGELRLEIPQVRGLRFYPQSLERGCRSEKALKLAIAEMCVLGVSTRKVTEITEQLCGLEISATQVSTFVTIRQAPAPGPVASATAPRSLARRLRPGHWQAASCGGAP